MTEILKVNNLSVEIKTDAGLVKPVRDVSFALKKGEILAIVGESGCGKSMLCKSIMGVLTKKAQITGGSIEKLKKETRIRMVLQDPMTSLNPTMTIGKQIAEAIAVENKGLSKKELWDRTIELMKLVGISRPEERANLYPYDFSGGMRQRSVMAIALAADPDILIADEPTTALDVTIQAQILDLLRDIQKKLGTAVILVSHDLGVVARAADRVAIMYAGKIVEIGKANEVYYDPRHPYTWCLMRSLPSFAKRNKALYTIPGMPPTLIDLPKGDAFACRNEYALDIDYQAEAPMFQISDTHFASTWLLDPRAPKVQNPINDEKEIVSNISKEGSHHHKIDRSEGEFILDVQHLTHKFLLTKKKYIKAVDDVSFKMKRGEILGLVGESGSGKSTIARCVMNIYRASAGDIFFDGINVCDKREFKSNRKLLGVKRQIIFQDSASSLNPRMKVADIIAEPMAINHVAAEFGSLRKDAEFQLKYVGMDKEYLNKYPAELSGGQRQRVAIARALSVEPNLLVADEPIASLDVSVQAQIVNLFKHMQEEHGFSILFIAHDLAMVEYLCDRVGVMYKGKIVELASTEELYNNPLHPYTQMLLADIPLADPIKEKERKIVTHSDIEINLNGELKEVKPGHFVLYEEK